MTIPGSGPGSAVDVLSKIIGQTSMCRHELHQVRPPAAVPRNGQRILDRRQGWLTDGNEVLENPEGAHGDAFWRHRLPALETLEVGPNLVWFGILASV